MKTMYPLIFFFNFVLLLFLTTCATRNDQYIEIDKQVNDQNFADARQLLQENKQTIYPETDYILYYLDDGLLAFYDQNTNDSIQQLSEAERLMEEAHTKQVSQEILSYLINDTVKTYAGEDHELIFTNLFLSLNYLKNNDFDSGFIEIKRSLNTIQKIQANNQIIYDSYNQSKDAYVQIEKYNIPIIDTAFLRLLSSWMYRADGDRNNYEVALRNYNNAINAQPHLYPFDPPRIGEPYDTEENISTNFTSYQNNPNLQVIALTGRSPIKIEKGFSINTIDGVAIVTAFDEQTTLGNTNVKQSTDSTTFATAISIPDTLTINAKFSLPELAMFSSTIASIEIHINDTSIGTLQKIEDVATIIKEIFEAKRNFIYAKTISRVIGKAILTGAASSLAEQGGAYTSLITDIAGGLFNNFSEKADLRSARFFPSEIWIGDFLLEGYDTEKQYPVSIRYYDDTGTVVYSDTKHIMLKNALSSLNLVTSTFLY